MTRWSRWAAVLIALVGVIDPALRLARSPRPVVSILGAAEAPALADRIGTALNGSSEVTRGLDPTAVAVVLVGDRLPPFAEEVTVPAFVVTPSAFGGPIVDIDDLSGPARSHLEARVPVRLAIHVMGGRGETLSVALKNDGVVLDRTDRTIAGDDVRLTIPLTFVPAAVGPARIHVAASLTRPAGASPGPASATAAADTLTVVDKRPWSIFVFDRRPSWMSTFVRRALEDDDRFTVTSRTVTSRSAATDTPNAPIDLSNIATLSRFDAIVVGAPDAVTPDDVAGLGAFLRRRGGSVLCLWDVRPTGPVLSLLGVDPWRADTRNADSAIRLPGGAIRASDVAWPARLPPSAAALGTMDEPSATAAGPAPPPAPVVWQVPVGLGTLIVSGALDSWRYRNAAQAAFDAAWRQIVAEAAEGALAPLEVSIDRALVRPGELVQAHVRLRDSEPTASTTLRVRLTGPDGAPAAVPLRAWPDAEPNGFLARFEAPTQPGTYHLVGEAGALTAEADLVVDPTATPARRGERDVLAGWASARGGRIVDPTALADLRGAIGHLAPAAPTRRAVYPMRSAWWIAPVTLLLGIDWLSRRRRGLR